jgi:hypothetical protein
MRTQADELNRLAQRTLDLAASLGDQWRPNMGLLTPASGAFPPVTGVDALRRAHESVIDAADIAVRRLLDVVEGDAERVWRVSFAYAEADRRAEDALKRTGRPIP